MIYWVKQWLNLTVTLKSKQNRSVYIYLIVTKAVYILAFPALSYSTSYDLPFNTVKKLNTLHHTTIGHAHSFNTEPAATSGQASLESRFQGPIYKSLAWGMSLLETCSVPKASGGNEHVSSHSLRCTHSTYWFHQPAQITNYRSGCIQHDTAQLEEATSHRLQQQS